MLCKSDCVHYVSSFQYQLKCFWNEVSKSLLHSHRYWLYCSSREISKHHYGSGRGWCDNICFRGHLWSLIPPNESTVCLSRQRANSCVSSTHDGSSLAAKHGRRPLHQTALKLLNRVQLLFHQTLTVQIWRRGVSSISWKLTHRRNQIKFQQISFITDWTVPAKTFFRIITSWSIAPTGPALYPASHHPSRPFSSVRRLHSSNEKHINQAVFLADLHNHPAGASFSLNSIW